MARSADEFSTRTPGHLFGWTRIKVAVVAAVFIGLLLSISNETATLIVIARVMIVAAAVLTVFGILERWPRTLPRRLARSVLQLIAIVIIVPPAAAVAYITTSNGNPNFQDKKIVAGYASLVFSGILFAPWIAVGAMLKQRNAFAHEQALAFELQRSQLERSALDAQLRLLQAQVEPHFLFNTLANVQALVDTGSPQASRVLASLIAYLRAAVPRVHDTMTTFEQELDLVRAYLEVMQMRMPDRLEFDLRSDDAVRRLQCPPTTVLTLVENAVRHGIDPREDGGRIDIEVTQRDSHCIVRVTDTGVGLHDAPRGLGTGLANLRERLRLTFGVEPRVQLESIEPHGTRVEVMFPARASQ